MKRNPKEVFIQDYKKDTILRMSKPILWHECCNCEQEFRRERMYYCDSPMPPFTFRKYTYGCEDCFDSMKEFEDYLVEQGTLLMCVTD